MNFRIQVLNTEGQVVSVFGKAGDSTGFLARPKGIATDSYGNIYVVDALFHAVQVFDLKGNFLYTFGSQGHNQGEFWMPNGIFIDQQDNIYVADTYNSRVQIFKLIYTGAR
jgi:DNA-binding beta-propeller fold protein YncE